jgi:hypothetical protein
LTHGVRISEKQTAEHIFQIFGTVRGSMHPNAEPR